MEKPLVLMFSVDTYDREKLQTKKGEELYELAQKGVEEGDCDIYTFEEFLFDINEGEDCLNAWWCFPYYVPTLEAIKWLK